MVSGQSCGLVFRRSLPIALLLVGGCKRYENRPEGRTKAELHVIQVSVEAIAHADRRAGIAAADALLPMDVAVLGVDA